MKHKNILTVIVILFTTFTNVNAQNFFGQLLNSFVQGASQGIEIATLKKVINNPSLQSTDMKNYLANYRNGDAYMTKGDYRNAVESYSAAWNIAVASRDMYLKKLWSDYGWAQDTTTKMNKARSLAGISTNSSAGYFSGGYDYEGSNSYSSGSSSSSSSSSQKSRVCSLCKGTGLKIKEHYGAGQRKYCSTCGKEVSTGHMHVRCDLCNGTGSLNY